MTPPDFCRELRIALRDWWREHSRQSGTLTASTLLVDELWTFLRDSTPERRRRRYGDMEYDWEHRVNTTSGKVDWRERLLGVFYSPYQPTDSALFQEIMASLLIDFSQFTFVDLGSGKGRTLLMASEHPFRRIVGVEILSKLHRAALENIRAYQSSTQQCKKIESLCTDVRDFDLPDEPLLLYLFNPLPDAGLAQVLTRLENSLHRNPRPLYVLYHNPLLEERLRGCPWLKQAVSMNQFAIYQNREPEKNPK